jgi:quercetin dioxygenase-like cupin family protein
MTTTAAENSPPTTMALTGNIPWVELHEGIEMKMLRRGDGTGIYTVMNRFAPGIELPKHRHVGAVHGYTLQGRWGYREYDWLADAGGYVFEPSGSVHTLYVPEGAAEQAVVVFIIEEALILLDENDEEFMRQDAATIDEMYRGCLAARGIDYPEDVLS